LDVVLAEKYGFCFGVKRAIDMATQNHGSSTIGPLIHNQKEIDRLDREFGVKVANDIELLDSDDTALIRTHGIPRNDLQTLKRKNISIVDATCPFVTKPQKICEEMTGLGYQVVVFGDIKHPEIKGVISYAQNDSVIVVSSRDDLHKHNLTNKIAAIAQTTKKDRDYKDIINYLMDKSSEVRVFNTICDATSQNQQAAQKLSSEVDVMIIIGGKNSSNTKQLLEICQKSSVSYLIEDENDLKKEWFSGRKKCGISAGASTPDWIINSVVDKIKLL
jgi:4-hydroxy-3-methylbut-2-enyl diphosphate reductase